MRKNPTLWTAAALALLGVITTLIFRSSIYDLAFDVTGEEDPGSQAFALTQLALNVTHMPLRLQPDAQISHTGVNPFGINTFLQQEVEVAKREETLRLIAEAGFGWIRQEFSWEDIEIHGRGDFTDRRHDPVGIDAWAKYDNIVDLAEEYDIQIIARLSSPPAWSRALPPEETGFFAPPDDITDYANFAAAVAERYRGRIRYYQIWNEPNIYPEWGEQTVSPEAYTALLCETALAIRAVDPDAVIISGALAPTAELSGRDLNDFIFLQRMYDAGASACFDILSMQGYGLWSGPTDRRMRPLVVNYGRNLFIRDMMVRNGDATKPIWISEMNWNAAPQDVEPRYGRVTLDQQARWAPLAYQRAQEEWPWVGVIAFWYFKRADSTWLDERRPEAYFQMAEPDFSLLPVYDSMRDYATQPPMMYRGTHAPDHWAVSYGEGWSVGAEGARAEAGAGDVAFTFDGTALDIEFGPEERPESAITFSVDGGQPITMIPHTDIAVWKGGSGHHTVIIHAEGDVTLLRFAVRKTVPVIIPAIGSLLLVIAGVVFAAGRKLDPEKDSG